MKHSNRLEKTLPQSISNDHSLTPKSKSFVDHDPFLEGGKEILQLHSPILSELNSIAERKNSEFIETGESFH